jgi:hypothetical protein
MPRVVKHSASPAVKEGSSRRDASHPTFIPPQLSRPVENPPKARRYAVTISRFCAKGALVAGRRAEALSLVRLGLQPSEEFVGPILFGLLAIVELSPVGQEAAISAGESLLVKGAIGHNHFWFRRYTIERAFAPKTGTRPTDTRQRHRAHGAGATFLFWVSQPTRTTPRPRGPRRCRRERCKQLSELRLSAAKAGLRMGASGEAMHQ